MVVQKQLDNRAIELGWSEPASPPTIVEHVYGDDNGIAEVHRWNESTDKALCFDFVEIVSVQRIEDSPLLSPLMEEPPTLVSKFPIRNYEDLNNI